MRMDQSSGQTAAQWINEADAGDIRHVLRVYGEEKFANLIANKIVAKHGGDIQVESEPGQGTRFVIRLPLEAKPSTKPAPE